VHVLGDIYLGLLAAIKARLLSIVSQFDVPGINTPVYVMILTLNYKHKILRYLPQCAQSALFSIPARSHLLSNPAKFYVREMRHSYQLLSIKFFLQFLRHAFFI